MHTSAPDSSPATTEPMAAAELWGFFHTDCIHESAYGLQSLHPTKAEAWRAMHRAQWDAWVAAQTPDNLPRKWRLEKCWMTGRVYINERSRVRKVEVAPRMDSIAHSTKRPRLP